MTINSKTEQDLIFNMYIGINGDVINYKKNQIKDALIYNFSIDKRDLPFNTSLGITKLIPNNNSRIVSDEIKLGIQSVLNGNSYLSGVSLANISVEKENYKLVLNIDSEQVTLTI